MCCEEAVREEKRAVRSQSHDRKGLPNEVSGLMPRESGQREVREQSEEGKQHQLPSNDEVGSKVLEDSHRAPSSHPTTVPSGHSL